jgi:rod shape-determining protein MreD
MTRDRTRGGLFPASIAVALLLGLLPFPDPIVAFKPYWLALVLVYWLMEAPERAGLGVAFLIGLFGDLLYGTLLGEQALRLTMLAFIVLRFRARLRFFPLWQQALAVLVLLINDRVVVLMVRGFTGEGVPPLESWLSPLPAALLWPWIFLLLDDLRLKTRERT